MTFLEFRDKMLDLGCFSIHQVYAWQRDFDRNNDIERKYLNELFVKAENLLKKKIRIAIFSKEEFKIELLEKIEFVSLFE